MCVSLTVKTLEKTISVRGMEEVSERMDHLLALRRSRWEGAADVWLLHYAVGSGTVEGWICSSVFCVL